MAIKLFSDPIAIPSKFNETKNLSDAVAIPTTYGFLSGVVIGTGAADFTVLSGYSVEIRLSMYSQDDSRGYRQWLDNGKAYDSYTNSFRVLPTDPKAFENLLVTDSTNVPLLTTPIENGFYPFGMGFATGQNYPVLFQTKHVAEDQGNMWKQRVYELEATPAVKDIYTSLNENTTINGCTRYFNHWTLGGVAIPYGEFEDSVNQKKRVIIQNGFSTEIKESVRTYGDVADIKVRCTEEQARQILQYITGTMRGTTVTSTFPSSYGIFGRRYHNTTSASVILYNNIIRLTHVRASIVDIEFSLQMVG